MADKVLNTRSGYSVYDLMNSVLGAAEPDAVQVNSSEYIELLTTIRGKISEEHANTLNSILTNPNAHNIMMPIILGYVTDYVNNTNDVSININRTAERIYQDMAGFGILTPYLNDPTVEEININAWNAIEILWSDRNILLEDTFSSPQECTDIIRKMVRIGGVHIDYSQPIIDSFIGEGTRISATLPPVNAEITGATASIRKQTYKNVTRENYISMGFATDKVWDFLDTAIKHNVSLGLAGSPGAGKTTLMTCLLKAFLHSKTAGNNRICTIEEAREIDLTETEDINPSGGHPRMLSRVLQFNTTQGEHPVTARKLIRHALRVNPQIIVPAEMRGEEAIEAVEAGLTGVQIVSSFHAWGAKDGYVRIQSMCQMGHGGTSENALLQMIIRAFPVMVFIKKDDDGVRRIHEIFEATGVEDGHVIGNTIFRFIRTRVIENEEGRIVKIEGKFVQQDSISKAMRRLLIQNGARKEMVDQFYFEGENPEHPEQYEEGNVEIVTLEGNVHEEFPLAPMRPEVDNSVPEVKSPPEPFPHPVEKNREPMEKRMPDEVAPSQSDDTLAVGDTLHAVEKAEPNPEEGMSSAAADSGEESHIKAAELPDSMAQEDLEEDDGVIELEAKTEDVPAVQEEPAKQMEEQPSKNAANTFTPDPNFNPDQPYSRGFNDDLLHDTPGGFFGGRGDKTQKPRGFWGGLRDRKGGMDK